jgi:hypothetical protein
MVDGIPKVVAASVDDWSKSSGSRPINASRVRNREVVTFALGAAAG